MPALPWTVRQPLEAGHEYVVMASRLPLRKHRHIPAFLRATTSIRGQLADADGLLGYTLDAHPLGKTFWTLSVWRDQAALDAFARRDPHAARVGAVRPHMGRTTFVTWTTSATELPTWAEARRRVAAAEE